MKHMNPVKTTVRQMMILLAFGWISSLCYGQEQHLEPAEDLKQYDGALKAYYDSVFSLLYEGFSEKPVARYTSLPSFSKEHAFSLETVGGRNYVVSNTLLQNYWYAKERRNVKLTTNRTELISDLFLRITTLFKLLEEQTKEPKTKLYGFDGVTYYFTTTTPNGQIKTGETWSPAGKSLLGKVVEICNRIYLLGSGKDVSQAALLTDLDKLISNLKQ